MKKSLNLLLALSLAGPLTAQNRLTPELMLKFGRVSEPLLSPDGKTVLYGVTRYDLVENKGNRDLFTIPFAGGESVQITHTPGSEQNAVWRPDGKRIGFLSKDGGSMQMWEMDPNGSNKVQLTSVEDGIDGFIYSPDMKNVLYIKSVKLDKTPSEIYPDLPKVQARIIDGLFYRHWDEWDDYSYSHIFVAPYSATKIENGKDIMPGERFDSPVPPMGGMEQINFSPDGKWIAYSSKKVNGTADAVSTNSDVYLYSLENGKTTNLTEGMNGYDMEASFSPDGKKIAWLSMATAGYESDKNRLFVCDLASKTKEDLTASLDQSAQNINWSKDSKTIFFASEVKATQQIYSVDLKSKQILRRTDGVHDLSSLNVSGDNVIAIKTTMSEPAEVYKVNLKEGKIEQLTTVNKTMLAGLKFGKVESKYYTTSDGQKLQSWIIYPPDFDPAKKYPTLLYCQGGPQGAISQSFSYRWNFQLMSANGYIVVAPNRRGVTSFGQKWVDAIAGDWGGQAINDYLTAIDSASKMPCVNKDKLGCVGASYGGYSVYYLAGVHNHRFKTFISHCGLFDLQSWYPSTEETFFANHDMGGAYWNKPQPVSYQKSSPSSMVGKWDTPILVIHNQKDFRVPVEQGMQAFGAAQLKGIPSRFLYFPDEGHWVNKPQNSVLWNRVFFDWLDKYLKDTKS